MSIARRLLSGTVALSASAFFATGIRALVALALVRHLGPNDFGAFAACTALAAMGSYIVDAGTGFHLVRAVSRDPNRAPRHLGNALLITAVGVILVCGALNGAAWTLPYPEAARMLMPALGLGVVLQAARGPLHGTLRALGLMDRAAASEALGALTLGGLCAAGIVGGHRLGFFAWMHLGTGAVGVLIALLFVLPRVKPAPRRQEIPAVLRASLPFASSSALFIIYAQLDTVMLAILRTPAEVAIYAAPYKLICLLNLLPSAISSAILPMAFGRSSNDSASVVRIFQANLRYLAVVAVPATVAIAIWSEPITALLLGPEYGSSAPLLRLLALQVVLRYLSYAAADSLYAVGQEHRRVAIQGAGAGLNIVLNFALIPRWGAAGAAWATLLTEALLLTLLTLHSNRFVGALGFWRELRRPLVAAMPMAAIATWALVSLSPAGVHPEAWRSPMALVGLLGACALYGLGLLAQGFPPPSDRPHWQAALGRRAQAPSPANPIPPPRAGPPPEPGPAPPA